MPSEPASPQRSSKGAGGASCDPDAGIFLGKSVARRFLSPDGMIVLVGRTARDNDTLTFKLAAPGDFWLHVSGESGSHVVVRNPQGLDSPPRETLRFAAALAAGYSRAKNAGRVSVHLARCADVRKPPGQPPGKVLVTRERTVRTSPLRDPQSV